MLDKISLALNMENRRRHKDFNQIAKSIVDQITNKSEKTKNISEKEVKPPIGRAGGLIGGKARANILTLDQRSEIARNAAEKRWKK